MNFVDRVRSWFAPHQPLAQEMLHYQSPLEVVPPYRLHLRIEKDGRGLLIVNAATVVHLNQTATEYARLILQGVDEERAVRAIVRRYRVGPAQARADYRRLRDQIQTLATTTDVSPEIYLDTEQVAPFSAETSAPYRVDLALTYREEGAVLGGEACRRVDRELTTAEWQQVLNRLWEVGVPHVAFTGGEPTLRDDLAELVRHAEGLGMVTGVLTDGRRLRDYAYLEGLLQAGLDHLQITLASHRPEVHDGLIGQAGAWEETLAGLKNALAGDIYTVVHLVIIPENAATAAETIDYLAGLGVRAVALSSPLRALPEKDRPALREAMAAAQEVAHRRGLTLVWNLAAPYSHVNPMEIEADLTPADAARQYLYVEPDGDVLPAQGCQVVLGNILRDPWEVIWGNPARGRLEPEGG